MKTTKSVPLNMRHGLFVSLFFIISILAVYLQVRHHNFCLFDDYAYVLENTNVRSGITLKGLIWAFKSIDYGNWHPLTWLSHMIDVQLYGMHPGRHHMTNVILHVLNTILLFTIFRYMSGCLWRSAIVAMLFSLHPMHVESVAWISERKDVLSAFFWMLTIWFYIHYSKNNRFVEYALVVCCFVLGLMAKAMVVTLPFVLLLLDYWPLERFTMEKIKHGPKINWKGIPLKLLLEKIPLFVLIAISSIITYIAQSQTGSVASIHVLPLSQRVSNALLSYIHYICKMIVPYKLAIFYPYPNFIPVWMPIISLLFISVLSVIFIKLSERYKYLIVGWLWYLGTLVPVIGFIQIGRQSIADRYTYIPSIGLFIIVSWGISDVVKKCRWKRKPIVVIITMTVFLLMVTAWMQTSYWSNNIRLFHHALNVTRNNGVVHECLGKAYAEDGKLNMAIKHYFMALRYDPQNYALHHDLGVALTRKGKIADAIFHYKKSVSIQPKNSETYNNLGSALMMKGNIDEAIEQYQKALNLKIDYADAYYNLGTAYHMKGNIDNAILNYRKCIKYDPANAKAHTNLGVALEKKGMMNIAVRHYAEALKLNNMLPEANFHFANALYKRGKLKESIIYYKKVLDVWANHEGAKNKIKHALKTLKSQTPKKKIP